MSLSLGVLCAFYVVVLWSYGANNPLPPLAPDSPRSENGWTSALPNSCILGNFKYLIACYVVGGVPFALDDSHPSMRQSVALNSVIQTAKPPSFCYSGAVSRHESRAATTSSQQQIKILFINHTPIRTA